LREPHIKCRKLRIKTKNLKNYLDARKQRTQWYITKKEKSNKNSQPLAQSNGRNFMTILTTENIFLLFFCATIVAGIYFIVCQQISAVKQFQLIIMYLGGVSVLLISFNLYFNIKSNKKIEENRIAYDTIENVQNNYLDPQKELLDYFPESYFLYVSMNQDMQFTEKPTQNYDHAKRKEVELYGSLRVFQAMEDFLTTAPFDVTGSYIWLNVFLLWMQSSILQQHWKKLSPNFDGDTQEFIDLIIKKARELAELRKKKGTLTNKDYDAISIPLARLYD
jgi:hypothetical protein